HKEIISFSLNAHPAPGEGKVKANVITQISLVPVKDWVKYEDGLFYNQQIVMDNIKAANSQGKEVAIQKQCGSYSQEDIFYDDTKICIVKFPLEEKGKAFTYSYKENYRDIKYLTSFYFNKSIPVVDETIEFYVPSWMEIDLRKFNFQGSTIEKTTAKEKAFTKISFHLKNAE